MRILGAVVAVKLKWNLLAHQLHVKNTAYFIFFLPACIVKRQFDGINIDDLQCLRIKIGHPEICKQFRQLLIKNRKGNFTLYKERYFFLRGGSWGRG